MTVRTVTIAITGSSAQLQAALKEAGIVADETATGIGTKFEAAGGKVGGIFTKLGTSAEKMGIPFASSLTKMGEKFDGAATKGQKFGQTLKAAGGIAVAAFAVAAVELGKDAIEMADAFDVANASLDTAIKNSGENLKTAQPLIDQTTSSMAKLGFNSTDTATALTGLVTSTGSVKKATDLMSTAADLARFKHISLTDASQLLGKVMAGSNRVLTQMGLNLDVGTGKLATIRKASESLQTAQIALQQVQAKVAAGTLKGAAAHDALANAERSVSLKTEALHKDQSAIGDVIDAIKKKTEGSANAYGKTLAGQMQVARAEIHNMGTELGEKLMPILERFIGIIAKVVGWLLQHKAVLIGVATVIGGVLAVAMIAFTASMISMAAAATTAGLTTAAAFVGIDIAAGPVLVPILAIIAAVAAIGVAAYELYTHWNAIWQAVSNVVGDAVNFIKSHWELILGILLAPFAPVIFVVGKFHDSITGALSDVVTFLGSIWSKVEGALKAPFDAAWTGIKAVINKIIDGANTVIGGLDHIPFVNIPKIPMLAKGGDAQAGSPYIIGERGPELFVPNTSGRVIPNDQLVSSAKAAAAASTQGHGNQHIEVHGYNLADPQETASEIGWRMRFG